MKQRDLSHAQRAVLPTDELLHAVPMQSRRPTSNASHQAVLLLPPVRALTRVLATAAALAVVELLPRARTERNAALRAGLVRNHPRRAHAIASERFL
jgi:hypothetical protein